MIKRTENRIKELERIEDTNYDANMSLFISRLIDVNKELLISLKDEQASEIK